MSETLNYLCKISCLLYFLDFIGIFYENCIYKIDKVPTVVGGQSFEYLFVREDKYSYFAD